MKIADELTRAFGLPVPASLCGSTACRISTAFFDRRHLPNRKLTLSFSPILVSPRGDGSAMVVPARSWPEAFVREWMTVDGEAKLSDPPVKK